jgi:hypothetical protein
MEIIGLADHTKFGVGFPALRVHPGTTVFGQGASLLGHVEAGIMEPDGRSHGIPMGWQIEKRSGGLDEAQDKGGNAL